MQFARCLRGVVVGIACAEPAVHSTSTSKARPPPPATAASPGQPSRAKEALESGVNTFYDDICQDPFEAMMASQRARVPIPRVTSAAPPTKAAQSSAALFSVNAFAAPQSPSQAPPLVSAPAPPATTAAPPTKAAQSNTAAAIFSLNAFPAPHTSPAEAPQATAPLLATTSSPAKAAQANTAAAVFSLSAFPAGRAPLPENFFATSPGSQGVAFTTAGSPAPGKPGNPFAASVDDSFFTHLDPLKRK